MTIIPCHELYSSPEFIAFARKIGIPWEQGIRNLMIIMPMDGTVQVLMDFHGTPPEEVAFRKKAGDEILMASGLIVAPLQPDAFVETTSEHNKRYRTYLPKDNKDG